MNILLIGSGGREHALAWKVAASPLVERLFCAPGNAGIAREGNVVNLDPGNHEAVIGFCRANRVDLVVIGPEAPMAAGMVDDLAAAGIKAFGASRAAARLETSKGFTKDLCRNYGISTAAYERFKDAAAAKAYARARGAPIVVKADGLAAGKGVVVAQTLAEAEAAIDMMFGGGLGAAGAEVVIEEFLEGEEASFFALCDGETAVPLVSAQDHKRVFDGDRGPNTGGMGAYSPVAIMTPAMERRAMDEFVLPTVKAMKDIGAPYKGVLYLGLMITAEGPKLIEYNVRFGDPECQVLMLRLMSDLVPALMAATDGQLKNFDLRWFPDTALTVVMATDGYPGGYAKGSVVEGLDAAAQVEGVEIFHAGTAERDGRIVANGGRVLNVCATGKTVAEAQARAYRAVDLIRWPDGFCRRDIGWRAVEREFEVMAKSLALALGGGGARGIAHIAVLEVLDEMGVVPTAIAGSSVGAMIGAAYAAGLSGRDIRRHVIALAHNRSEVLRRLVAARAGSFANLFSGGFGGAAQVDGEKFCEQFMPNTMPADFGGLRIPLVVIASDLYRRQQVLLTSGPLRRAIAASIALPTVVRPVVIDDQILVDGGATNPLPFDVVSGRAEVVLAVDISGEPNMERRDIPSPWEAILNTILVMGQAITTEKLKHGAPDLIVRPKVGLFRTLDFFQASAVLRVCEPSKAEIRQRLETLLR